MTGTHGLGSSTGLAMRRIRGGTHVCSTTGLSHLGRLDAGSLTALTPCCWTVGSYRTPLQGGEAQSEVRHSGSWVEGLQACKEVRAVWFSGSWAFRRCWDAAEELRTEWRPSGVLDLAQSQGRKRGDALAGPIGESFAGLRWA